jgi:hypothetical protein
MSVIFGGNGQEGEFWWGAFGKRKKYKIASFKEVPDLSIEERRKRIMDKMKPWKYSEADPFLSGDMNVEVDFGGGGVYDTSPLPNPSPTPTPSATPGPSTGTTEAQRFLRDVLNNGGTLDSTVSAATITFFNGLFTNNLWNNLLEFYPSIGGTQDSNKLGGKGSYNLSYNGGWTFNYSGQTPNGVNGIANTGINPASPSLSSFFGLEVDGTIKGSMGGYFTTASTVPTVFNFAMGAFDPYNSGFDGGFALEPCIKTGSSGGYDLTDGRMGVLAGNNQTGVNSTNPLSGTNGTISFTYSGNSVDLYHNTKKIETITTAFGRYQTDSTLGLGGARRSPEPTIDFSNHRIQFAFYTGYLNETQHKKLNELINQYQTDLLRNNF